MTSWTDEQTAVFTAFEHGSKHLLVRARAGSGKTTTIVEACRRFGAALRTLLVAFNADIASELKRRTAGFADARTLHSLGNGCITAARPAMRCVGRDSGQLNRDRAKKAMLAHRVASAPREAVTLVADIASKIKNCAPFADAGGALDLAARFAILPPREVSAKGWGLDQIVEAALAACKLAVEDGASYTYDDQIYLPLALDLVRPAYDLVIVDEAQDMNAAQIDMAIRSIVDGGRIVIVGDDRQAIYAWRGAAPGIMDALLAKLRADELPLTTTFRCARAIVRLAQVLVPDIQPRDDAPDGIVDRINYESALTACRPGDFAVCRSNAPAFEFCLRLMALGTPAYVASGRGADLARDLLMLLGDLAPYSMESLKIAAKRWIEDRRGERDRENTETARRAYDAKADRLRCLMLCAASSSTIGALKKLIGACCATSRDPKVRCSSVHAAKGLEARRVFFLDERGFFENVVGDDGELLAARMPRHPPRADGSPSWLDAEEEHNIRYVAVTRAIEHLTIVRTPRRECGEAIEADDDLD